MLWVGVLCGEGTHAHHHAFGSLAHRPGIDLPFHIFLRPLLALGLVWDAKLAGRESPDAHLSALKVRTPPIRASGSPANRTL